MPKIVRVAGWFWIAYGVGCFVAMFAAVIRDEGGPGPASDRRLMSA